MARGPRKTIEDKIAVKQDLIASLLIRLESEKKELEEMFEEKRRKDLESVEELISEAGLSPEEAVQALQSYIDNKITNAS